jgi:hypothetical protein
VFIVLPTNLPTDFTDGINSVGNSVGKSLIFFPTIIPSVYTDEIFLSVKSLENLPTKIFSRYFRLYLSIFWQWSAYDNVNRYGMVFKINSHKPVNIPKL